MRDLSLPAIHKHVKVLENAGLVTRKKTGRTTFLTLDRGAMRGLQQWLAQFHTYWGSEDQTLANYTDHLNRDTTTTKD
jgi:hypothetical protein